MQGALLLIPAGIAGGLVLTRWNARRRLRCAGVREVGVSETVDLINDHDAIVVDVREDREYSAGRIPNSWHVPLGQVNARIKELEKLKGRPIVVSCRSGRRSAVASLMLCKNGFDSVYNLKGGVTAWSRANLRLER